jgi:hypothetical protein
MTRLIAILLILAAPLSAPIRSQEVGATTDDGKRVLLKKDGTWRYAENNKPKANTGVPTFSKPGRSTREYSLRGGRFAVWYDPALWTPKESDTPTRITFNHKDGDVYGLIIAERIGMTTEALKEVAVQNARKAAPNIEVTFEERRVINGKEVLCMQMKGTIQSIDFIYYGYYYGGKGGSIQCLTYTSQNLFAEYETAMKNFLDGLVIND